MRRITLNGTSIRSSILGFGCITLTIHEDRAKALAILEAAWNAGITHFDVAPIYGFGEAERILGEFLQGKRDRATVATKFGLQPNQSLAKHRRLVSIVRRAMRKLSALRYLVNRAQGLTSQAGAFDPKHAAVSLENSLRQLRTDHIDIYQLHEASLVDARRDDLVQFLEDQVRKGRIRYCGPSSAARRLEGDLRAFPTLYRVFEFDSNVVTQHCRSLLGTQDKGTITFGGGQVVGPLVEAARARPEVTRRWSEQIGAGDLSDPAVVLRLVRQDSVRANPDGIVLFGTPRMEHLLSNVQAVAEPLASDEQLSRFSTYAREVLAGGGPAA